MLPSGGANTTVDRAMAGNSKKTLKVTQIKSTAGRLKNHKACAAGLGLRRIGHTVEVEDTAAVRGMINKINYLIRIEE